MTERKERLYLFDIVVSISNEESFTVLYLTLFTRPVQKCRAIFQTKRKGLREFTRWVDLTSKNVCNSPPPACPANQPSTIAETWFTQGIVIADPLVRITTVFD